uniref:Uncharacterized protein n=1 Tax=Pseudomonas aeruginosa TaxID=287 RepID=A0A2L1KFF0_PSEAI|nr:Hypothetical protein [Pseudomonas aeruginosa]
MIPPARHLTSVGLGTTSERAVAIATRRGPGYLQRLKRKPGLLGCAEEALKVAVEYFTGLAAAGHDLAAHLQVLDVDSATGITLLVRQLGFQLIYDRASAFGGGPASALH